MVGRYGLVLKKDSDMRTIFGSSSSIVATVVYSVASCGVRMLAESIYIPCRGAGAMRTTSAPTDRHLWGRNVDRLILSVRATLGFIDVE